MTDPHRTTTRRSFLQSLGAGVVVLPTVALAQNELPKKTHILTLSFDDGLRKSSIRTAEIYEKYGVKACFNIIDSLDLQPAAASLAKYAG